MPEFLPGAVFSGILTVVFVIVQRGRAGKPRLSAWKLGLIGIAAAYVIPWALALSAKAMARHACAARSACHHLRSGVHRSMGSARRARH